MAAVECFHAGNVKPDFSFVREFAHLVDAVLCRAIPVRMMDERQRFRDRRQVQCPVESAVAAACDEDVLAPKRFHLSNGVVHTFAVAEILIGLDPGYWWSLWNEAAAAGRNDQ